MSGIQPDAFPDPNTLCTPLEYPLQYYCAAETVFSDDAFLLRSELDGKLIALAELNHTYISALVDVYIALLLSRLYAPKEAEH